jgi:hypothetical protein
VVSRADIQVPETTETVGLPYTFHRHRRLLRPCRQRHAAAAPPTKPTKSRRLITGLPFRRLLNHSVHVSTDVCPAVVPMTPAGFLFRAGGMRARFGSRWKSPLASERPVREVWQCKPLKTKQRVASSSTCRPRRRSGSLSRPACWRLWMRLSSKTWPASLLAPASLSPLALGLTHSRGGSPLWHGFSSFWRTATRRICVPWTPMLWAVHFMDGPAASHHRLPSLCWQSNYCPDRPRSGQPFEQRRWLETVRADPERS